jgi:hypothetical protein
MVFVAKLKRSRFFLLVKELYSFLFTRYIIIHIESDICLYVIQPIQIVDYRWQLSRSNRTLFDRKAESHIRINT